MFLCRHHSAKVKLPSKEEVAFFVMSSKKNMKHYLVFGGTADGLKLLIQSPTDDQKQNRLFNG